MDYKKEALKVHESLKGKLEIKSKVPLNTKDDLSIAYTPGVGEVCKKISEDKKSVYDYTIKGNSVAVITDGSSVLGFGNIGSLAAMPVMEGKAILFKEFAGIDAFPIILKKQDVNSTISTIKNIAPTFGGINLEDIKAPECFEIEGALQDIGIPVMHDDQHGTAVVVLAGLINAIKIKEISKEDAKIVIGGTGAAGVAITKMLLNYGFQNIILVDSKGAIYEKRDNLNNIKEELSKLTNKEKIKGSLKDVMKGSDIFIGVSRPGILTKEMVSDMNKEPIIFALSNPVPEIMPDIAKEAGAKIVATGRSDFKNQVNNVLAFPGIFKGALEIKAKKITEEMKLAAAIALANLVETPTEDMIIPNPLDKTVVPIIAEAVKKAYSL